MVWNPFNPSRGAIAVVSPVRRTDTAIPADDVRRSDPLDGASRLRPDPLTIPADDVLRFEGLVFGDRGRAGALDSARTASNSEVPDRSGADSVLPSDDAAREPFSALMTPADRIVSTLRRLSGLSGI